MGQASDGSSDACVVDVMMLLYSILVYMRLRHSGADKPSLYFMLDIRVSGV